ncbi:MAG: response regulator, partial [Candidatus Omnitrophica bacterium]|nr:response regulator [Candidatus Omnitrophota bacterium]
MKNIKLLIIDDQERLLQVIRLGLKPLGYDITTAADANRGLRLLLDKAFDILLTDIQMPEMTGLELIYELKRLNVEIPTLVMTAFADVDTTIKAFKHGVVDFIRKPFTIEE